MKNLFIVTIVLLFISTVSSGQIKRLDFVEKENKTKVEQGDNIRVVYFSLKNIDSKAKENAISKLMLNDSKVHDFLIKDLSKCYAVIDKDVSPSYIRKIIQNKQVDFDYTSLIVNDLRAITNNLPDEYPVYDLTKKDKDYKREYMSLVHQWKLSNKEKWQKIIREK